MKTNFETKNFKMNLTFSKEKFPSKSFPFSFLRSLVHFHSEGKQLLQSRRFPGDGAPASIGRSASRLLAVPACLGVRESRRQCVRVPARVPRSCALRARRGAGLAAACRRSRAAGQQRSRAAFSSKTSVLLVPMQQTWKIFSVLKAQ